ncbi:MAG: GatB/YqeY domain-containing protein [Gammaproteobacteria bacterium]|nr:MAG: GatB/YqeY domain-containing protein [Gammaproteobacteria bacterium]
MSLKEKITDDMKAAMRARDKDTLDVLRMAKAAIQRKEVDERIELDDAQTLAVLEKMMKQSRDAIEQFNKGGRDDLATKEQQTLDVLQPYLPEPLSDDEIAELIDQAISATGAGSIKDMGKVMGMLKPKLQGRADMGAVSKTIREKLA